MYSPEELLPLLYDELHRMASRMLANEKPGHSLRTTDLLDAAYLRLVDAERPQRWNNHAHFYSAAGEAMRRILVEQARRKRSEKRGGKYQRVSLVENEIELTCPGMDLDILALDEALSKLANVDPLAANVVHLHIFAGRTFKEIGEIIGISTTAAHNKWVYARSWLRLEMEGDERVGRG